MSFCSRLENRQAFLSQLTRSPMVHCCALLANGCIPATGYGSWFHDPVADIVIRRLEDRIELYYPCPDDGPATRQAQRYGHTRTIGLDDKVRGVPVSVISDGTTMQRLAPGPPLAGTTGENPTGFLEFLHSWKGEWMWEDLHMPLGLDAVVACIRTGLAVYVTDGSYMRTLDPSMWIIYKRLNTKPDTPARTRTMSFFMVILTSVYRLKALVELFLTIVQLQDIGGEGENKGESFYFYG